MEQDQDDFERGAQFAELVTFSPDGTESRHSRDAATPTSILLDYEDDAEEVEEELPTPHLYTNPADIFQQAQQQLLLPWYGEYSDISPSPPGEAPDAHASFLMQSVPYPLAAGSWGRSGPTGILGGRNLARHHPYSRPLASTMSRRSRLDPEAGLPAGAENESNDETEKGVLHPQQGMPIAGLCETNEADSSANSDRNANAGSGIDQDLNPGSVNTSNLATFDGEEPVHNKKFEFNVAFAIRLEGLAFSLHQCSYDPEIAPELYHRMESGIRLCIHESGKVVITGATYKKDVREAYAQIVPILKRYQQ